MRSELRRGLGTMACVVLLAALQNPTLGQQLGDRIRAESAGGCGENWSAHPPGTSSHLFHIEWTGSQFVVVGSHGTILTSPDAVTWTSRTSGRVDDIESVAWTGSRLVAVGGVGWVYTSPDGVTWQALNSKVNGYLNGVAWSGSRLVLVGGSGIIFTSPNGDTWTAQASGTQQDLYNVSWVGSQFVAEGYGGTIVTSPDGITWTPHTLGTPGYLYGIGSNGSQIIVVGSDGGILTSPDGITWTAQASGKSIGLYAVVWTGTQFVVVGEGGTVLTSPDGINWTSRDSGTTNYLEGLAWSGTQLVAVGTNSTIVVSACSPISYGYTTWIPVASHNPGKHNTQWRSDLGLLNTTTATANVELRFYGSGVVTSTTYVPARAQSILTDVVGQIGGSNSGAIEVLSDQPLRITARSYNLVASDAACYASGTQGQDYPALVASNGLSAQQSAYLAGLTEVTAGYHCNIGVVNIGSGVATVLVELFDGSGTKLTDYPVTLNPGDWKQETQPFFYKAGQTAMERGYAKVTVQSGAGVFAFASVVDNTTNDPTTVVMQP